MIEKNIYISLYEKAYLASTSDLGSWDTKFNGQHHDVGLSNVSNEFWEDTVTVLTHHMKCLVY